MDKIEPPAAESFSLTEMASVLGKSVPYIRHLQMALSLPAPRRGERFPESYVRFMRKIISLRTFNVPLDEIEDLLRKEIRLQELLHFDSYSDGPYWFLGPGDNAADSETHLLLTGRDLGFRRLDEAIQVNLDFRDRGQELFAGHEMGEDVRRVLDRYQERIQKMDARIVSERPVLQDALAWAGGGLVRRARAAVRVD